MQNYRDRLTCFARPLWPAEEKPLVFGEGKADQPPVMLIGEAPGEQETLQRRPFVGKAGKNLDGFLDVMQLKREDIYISNVVKIRPTRISPKGSVSNRPPSREELLLFTPYLMEEILLVKPRMIVTLGNVALRALMGPRAVIGDMHGRAWQAMVKHEKQQGEFVVFPLYHPASIIYNRALTQVYQEDLNLLRAWLDDHLQGDI